MQPTEAAADLDRQAERSIMISLAIAWIYVTAMKCGYEVAFSAAIVLLTGMMDVIIVALIVLAFRPDNSMQPTEAAADSGRQAA